MRILRLFMNFKPYTSDKIWVQQHINLNFCKETGNVLVNFKIKKKIIFKNLIRVKRELKILKKGEGEKRISKKKRYVVAIKWWLPTHWKWNAKNVKKKNMFFKNRTIQIFFMLSIYNTEISYSLWEFIFLQICNGSCKGRYGTWFCYLLYIQCTVYNRAKMCTHVRDYSAKKIYEL